MFRHTIIPILLSTIWISISEFVRNTFVLHDYWINHYGTLGISFPEEPINGAVWGLWSLSFALLIFFLAKKFTLLQTTFISWFAGFLRMWLVLGNLGVLPQGILLIAVPLSILESWVAAYISVKFSISKSTH